MKRWVPFAIAIFMLTPFGLWALFTATGLAQGNPIFESRIGTVLVLASLPLAGLFWIQNLRQLGDSMGHASRLRSAQKLTAVLPVAILAIGALGAVWIAGIEGTNQALAAFAATLAMAGLGALAARAPVEPGTITDEAHADPAVQDAKGREMLLVIGNILGVVLVGVLYWSPLAVLYAAYAAVPAIFAAMIGLAWWAAYDGVVETAPPARRRR